MIRVNPENTKAHFKAAALASVEAGTTTMARVLQDAERLSLYLDNSERLSDGCVDFEPFIVREGRRQGVSETDINTVLGWYREEAARWQ